jgi:alpha-tubulin suppressor-like RCC1 family protein
MRDAAGAVTCSGRDRVRRIALPAPAVSIDSETRYGCAVLATGAVYCWGNNEYGMFGNGATSRADLPPQPGAQGITDAVAVAIGPFHACAIRKPGTVACWGDRIDNTTLGDSDLVPVPIAGITDAKQLALGTGYSCVLRATGKVVCWGTSERGELGNGSIGTASAPVEVAGIDDAVQISGRHETVCVRRKTGAVACWGRNVEGQLGDGAVRPVGDPARGGRSKPIEVPALANVVEIAAGDMHTCAVLADGGVACWGRTISGEVGTIVTGRVATPISVRWP